MAMEEPLSQRTSYEAPCKEVVESSSVGRNAVW